MRHALVGCLALVLALGALSLSVHAEPPMLRDLPGGWPSGQMQSRWVAPCVAEFNVSVGGGGNSRTVWYAEDGSVLRELASPGGLFAMGREGGRQVVHGTLASWSVRLPPMPPAPHDANLYLHVSADGRTLMREVRGPDGRTSARIWVDGESVGTAGPLTSSGGRSFSVGDDGSLGLVAEGEDGSPVLHVFAPGAKASFHVPCGTEDGIDVLAPGGRGALLRRCRERGADEMLFASVAGLRALDLGVSPDVVAWVPGSSKALVSHGLEKDARLRLVDLQSGDVVWDVADQPLGGKRNAPGAAVEDGLVLLSGLEGVDVDGVSHWLRRVDALDVETGQHVAVWRSDYVGVTGFSEAPSFVRARERLWLVAPDQFAPVPIADIRAKRNGWE